MRRKWTAKSCGPDAPTLASRSRGWPRETTGAKEPGPRGERAVSRNTIAWGMPDVSGASAVNTRVHTPTTKRTRGCGCIGHPAFPAPSDTRGWHRFAKLGRIVPRECGGVSFQLFENRIGNGARTLYPRRPGEGQDPYAVTRVGRDAGQRL